MATKEQMARWAADWGAIVNQAGKKIDSMRFEDGPGGKERLTIILADGTRLGVEASGPLRAWVRR